MTAPQPPIPRSIPVIGWTTLLASALLMFLNFISLFTYNALDQMGFSSATLSQYVPDSMKRILDLYDYQRFWTIYYCFYLLFVVVASVQFLRLKDWGRRALEVACLVGLINAFVDSALSYYIWKSMETAMSALLRGIGSGQYATMSSIGYYSIVFGAILWLIPSIGMIVYLRRPKIREAVNRK